MLRCSSSCSTLFLPCWHNRWILTTRKRLSFLCPLFTTPTDCSLLFVSTLTNRTLFWPFCFQKKTKTKPVKSYLKYKQWLQWKRKPNRAGMLLVYEKTKLSNYTPKPTSYAVTSWNKTWPTSLKKAEWEFTWTHSSCIKERLLVGKIRSQFHSLKQSRWALCNCR